MRVISVNVNGIRAAHRNGGLVQLVDADVLCLQEVRADPEQLGSVIEGLLPHEFVEFAPCVEKGRNGVAILSRYPLQQRADELPGFEGSGRFLSCVVATPVGEVNVSNVYVPKGYATPKNTDDPRDLAKAEFLEALTTELPVGSSLLCGDLNIAHSQLDLRNWRGRIGYSGFRETERAVLDRWSADGWVDLVRREQGQTSGPYTWWSWRGKAFDNDVGWRIDYIWASADLAQRCSGTDVRRAPSYDERWSDHAPVVADFDD